MRLQEGINEDSPANFSISLIIFIRIKKEDTELAILRGCDSENAAESIKINRNFWG